MTSRFRREAVLVVAAAAWLASCGVAAAQAVEPLRGFVVDAQGATSSYPSDASIGVPRGIAETNLPTRGLGIQVGAHAYPVRWGSATLGFGASFLWTSGSKGPEPGEPEPPVAVDATEVTTRMTALMPQVSLNFGTGRGWSYLSGGVGTASLTVSAGDPEEPGGQVFAWNAGGGARWLFRDHLAFSFDARFLGLSSREASDGSPGHPSTMRFVLSAGLSFR